MIILLIGFFAAMLAALGFGGGLLLIPGLVLLCGIGQPQAQMYSLLTYLPISLTATAYHFKKEKINGKCLLYLIPGGLFGAAAGALAAGRLSVEILKKAYGLFLLVFGIYQAVRLFAIKK